ncbi:MAG: hypothetical protein EON88_22170, partial [Brevundimonas sp.]
MRYIKSVISVLSASTSFIALAAAAQTPTAASQGALSDVDEVIVLGSRIPRQIDTEGPAPVTTITAEDILR